MATWSMPLADFLERFEPGYGEDWPSAVDGLVFDPDDAEIITHLVSELAERGFDEPPQVEHEPVPRVVNGMHRIVAHILSGASTIEVTDDLGISVDWVVELKVRTSDRDTLMDILCGRKSFRLDENHWLEQVSLHSNSYSTLYTGWCGGSPDTTSALVEAVMDRIHQIEPGAQLLAIRAGTEDEWLADVSWWDRPDHPGEVDSELSTSG